MGLLIGLRELRSITITVTRAVTTTTAITTTTTTTTPRSSITTAPRPTPTSMLTRGQSQRSQHHEAQKLIGTTDHPTYNLPITKKKC